MFRGWESRTADRFRCAALPRGRTRAVSPVIAAILLVAIAVVLAAVLYVLVVGLAHSSSNVPLGTALALGPADALAGSASTKSYCAQNHGCYEVSIASANPSLRISDLDFAIQTNGGTDHLVTAGSGGFYIVNAEAKVVASSPTVKADHPLIATSWTFAKGYSTSTVLTSELSIWVEFGSATKNPSNHGFVLVASGNGAFEGTVTLPLP
ncbi:MAG TPA: archaellin/type IV pilin N-terminal domain-containing protein [Thermoplasmata archaeon]|nr:archaellin/type IV pilin N-terminal domain-containing protein [Thermoplasmata archaeon]